MQQQARLARLPEYLAHFAKDTLFLRSKEPPPPPPMKSWPELGTLSFHYPRIPPRPQWIVGQKPAPPNENLARNWHFEFWLPKNTPQPQWKVGQNLALWVLSTHEYLPPPENENLARTWHFKFLLPKNIQADGHCSGRYAYYWNAFLFLKKFLKKFITDKWDIIFSQ